MSNATCWFPVMRLKQFRTSVLRAKIGPFVGRPGKGMLRAFLWQQSGLDLVFWPVSACLRV